MISTTNSTQEHFTKLQAFRQALYSSVFTSRRDALAETLDALISNSQPVTSFPALSLSPVFQRQWPSIYAAVEDGSIDTDNLLDLLFRQLPPGRIHFYALDTWPYPRPRASTLPDRQFIYQATTAINGGFITIGYPYSTLAYVPEPGSSWALPLATHRIPADQTALQIGALQVQKLDQACFLQAKKTLHIVACDAKYGNYRFFRLVKGLNCGIVARLRKDRVLYREPPPPAPGKRGRPRKHGKRFAFKDPATWGPPDEVIEWEDPHWGKVRLERWNNLHDRRAADCPFDVVRARVHLERKKPPEPIWLGWIAPATVPEGIEVTARIIWEAYSHRQCIEGCIRFCKQNLGLVKPQFQEPEFQDRWVQLVFLAVWHFYLVREMIEQRVLPWQKKQQKPTPQRMQQSMGVIFGKIKPMARPPKRRGKSPGWPKGKLRRRKPRLKVVRKGSKRAKKA